MSDILVYNNWDPLEEIWLGDTYPAHFYDDLQSEVRDSFYQLTEWTHQDLNAITKKFNEFNVTVKRPTFKDKSFYVDQKLNKLLKPPICPRDDNAVIGDKLIYSNEYGGVYAEIANSYSKENIQKQNDFFVSGASIVKLGRDIIIDNNFSYNDGLTLWSTFTAQERKQKVFEHFKKFTEFTQDLSKNYRLHYSTNGGHADATFMPVRPGLVLGNNYWPFYELTLPNWKKLFLYEPTSVIEERLQKKVFDAKHPHKNSRWLVPQLSDKKHFNGFVNKYCKDWIGNYQETYFEVNIIMLDEKNLMCVDTAGIHEPIFEALHKEGINIHIVPWRTRNFWDGGLHCITLDVRRKATKLDYFPERGDNGIKNVLTFFNNNSLDLFYDEYNRWLESN
jgi:hypothetical protein